MQWRHWTPQETALAVEMRKAGLSASCIAEAVGKSETVVRGKMRRLGIRLTPEQRAEVNARCGMGNSGGIRNNQFASGPEAGGVQTAYELRQASEAFELAYCAAAERNGWPIMGYAA